jgi:hypothetical protein
MASSRDVGEGAGLHVDVTWNAKDAAAYARVTLARQIAALGPVSRVYSSAIAAVGGVTTGGLVLAISGSPVWATLATLMGIMIALAAQWAQYFDSAPQTFVERLQAADPASYPPRRITLTAAGIVETQDGFTAALAWHRIVAVTRSDGIIFAWISRSDSAAVPERCFANMAAADAFHAAIVAASRPALRD